MAKTYEVIQDTVLSGTSSIGIGANAEITIRDADTAALVTLFQDRLGAGGETNPFNADASGQFRVYTLPKRLQISIEFESVTRVWENFRLGPKTPKLASGDATKILKVSTDEDGYDLDAKMPDLAAGNSGEGLRVNSAGDGYDLADMPNRNHLINGGFDVWQRGTSFTSATAVLNSDDTYLMDRWNLLSDGNDAVDVSQETTIIPTGGLYSVKADVETPAKKFGFLQIIENKNALKLAGKTASLSFKARTTGGVVENLRAAVLAWDSTADSVTSDIVSAWEAEGTVPTLVANWAYENAAIDLVLTNAFQTFKIEGISIDTSGMTNLAVFIWVDDTDLIATDVFYLADVKLEEGTKATDYISPDFATELARCKRYYERIVPAVDNTRVATGLATAGTSAFVGLIYEVQKRATPGSAALSADSDFSWAKSAGANQVITSSSFSALNIYSAGFTGGVASGLAAGNAAILVMSEPGGFIEFDAEL